MALRQLRPAKRLEIGNSDSTPCLMGYRQRHKLADGLLTKGEAGPS